MGRDNFDQNIVSFVNNKNNLTNVVHEILKVEYNYNHILTDYDIKTSFRFYLQ